jgi:hypothetical protein
MRQIQEKATELDPDRKVGIQLRHPLTFISDHLLAEHSR